jgi:hypothetical protein
MLRVLNKLSTNNWKCGIQTNISVLSGKKKVKGKVIWKRKQQTCFKTEK